MKKKRIMVGVLSTILVLLLLIYNTIDEDNHIVFTRLLKVNNEKLVNGYVSNDLKVVEFDINDKEKLIKAKQEENKKEQEEIKEEPKEEVKEENQEETKEEPKEEVKEENQEETKEEPKEEIKEPKPNIVYDGMTLEELANKLDRSFNNELSGKGYLYASYSLERGVDPYLAAAISLEETGCKWNCSSLVKNCNNVGGMKGSGCGAYGYFDTLDNGIKAFIDNISRNYVAYGLTTADTMHHKYAENPLWASNVNAYIERIKNT